MIPLFQIIFQTYICIFHLSLSLSLSLYICVCVCAREFRVFRCSFPDTIFLFWLFKRLLLMNLRVSIFSLSLSLSLFHSRSVYILSPFSLLHTRFGMLQRTSVVGEAFLLNLAWEGSHTRARKGVCLCMVERER